MASVTGVAEILSSGEFDILDLERVDDVADRQRLLADLIREHGVDALLLSRPENFAWLTVGADATRSATAEPAARLFVTPEARLLVTNNVESQYLFDRELPGLGFQLKERPWFEPHDQLANDLCRGRKIGSDDGFGGSLDLSAALSRLRLPLTERERKTVRQLGREVVHAVEATARGCQAGETEAEIAAELAHRLIKHEIVPVRLQVCADGRFRRYPHYPFGNARVEANCVIAAVARRSGLHVACCRAVLFGEDKAFRDAHHTATLMQTTGLFFSRHGVPLSDVWGKVRRIYEKFGCPDEWQLADQGEVTGYALCESRVVPGNEFTLAEGMAVHWHPAVGPSLTGDTILVRNGSPELITPSDEWPQIVVSVRGEPISRPDVLIRE
ncbi:MAG: M24 family metallopeptidase [Planctomycetota bacterium]|nr:M24 family metallopeptidase [Planctomycetaceae bacterium]MDQ3330423.1 M24 family metallopeptidase [Planctomycetota bacterium]